MFNKILHIFGSRNISIFIILIIFNIFLTSLYLEYATIFFNEKIAVIDSFNIVVLKFLYGLIIGGYIFVYIMLFIQIINFFKIPNKISFIISNVNIYLLIYLILIIGYFIDKLSLTTISFYFWLLPVIGFVLMILQIKNVSIDNNISQKNKEINNELIDNIQNQYNNIPNSIPISGVDKFDLINKNNNERFDDGNEDITNKFNFDEKNVGLDKFDNIIGNNNNSNTTENDSLSKIKGFFGRIFNGKKDDEIDFNNINNPNESINFNNLELDDINNFKDNVNYDNNSELNDINERDFYEKDLSDNNKELTVEEIINTLDDEDVIKEVVNINIEDSYEMDENNYFKIDGLDDFDDDLDDLANIGFGKNDTISIIESNLEDKNIKLGYEANKSLSQYAIHGLLLNKTQDYEKVEALLNEL